MAVHQDQISLDVGGTIGEFVQSEFSMAGKIGSYASSLERDENVTVRVFDEDGAIVFETKGWVKAVTIETKPAKGESGLRGTIRKHAIKLGEVAPE